LELLATYPKGRESEEIAIVLKKQGVALMLSFKKLSLVKSSMK